MKAGLPSCRSVAGVALAACLVHGAVADSAVGVDTAHGHAFNRGGSDPTLDRDSRGMSLLVPQPSWVATLPGGKLPDRGDFKAYGDDADARTRAWRVALAESQRLADDFERLVTASSVDAEPLP